MQMAKTSAGARRAGRGRRADHLAASPTRPTAGWRPRSRPWATSSSPSPAPGWASPAPRVIEQTIRQRLPDGFQTAEFLLERRPDRRRRARGRASRPMLASAAAAAAARRPGRAGARRRHADAAWSRDPEALPERGPVAGRARWPATSAGRPRWTTPRHLLDGVPGAARRPARRATARRSSAASAGSTAGPVMLIGHQKGHTTPRSWPRATSAWPTPAGYRKAARLMRLADKLGAAGGDADRHARRLPGRSRPRSRGQAVAIAENLRLMATAAGARGRGGHRRGRQRRRARARRWPNRVLMLRRTPSTR